MNPAFGGFFQQAYVTNDMDEAMRIFRERYGVPSFFVMDCQYPVTYFGQPGLLDIRMALSNLNGVQIELIEPKPGCVDLYGRDLPSDAFAIVHHHVAVRVEGEPTRWAKWRAELEASGRTVAMEANLGDKVRFIYFDDRAQLGHYTEYLWTDETNVGVDSQIPSYQSMT